MKRFALALSTLLISLGLLVTSSFAWFSMNKTVSATGMEIQATTSTSLVIDSELGTTGIGTDILVDFDTEVLSLLPTTHDVTYPTGLKYIANSELINAGSGLKDSSFSETLAFANAENNVTNVFYVDYVVYIAASGADMLNQNLYVQLDLNNMDTVTDMRLATSIDFYLSDSSTDLGTYKGTLNIAQLDSGINDTVTTKTTVTLIDNGTIYKNGIDSLTSYLQVTMRIYFDGALLETLDDAGTAEINEEKTYVTTQEISTSSIELKLLFTTQTVE